MKRQLLITTFCVMFSGLCNWHLLHANTSPLHTEVIALKRQGWSFVGPTTVYAFMQAMGLVNDHVEGCFVREEAEAERDALERP